MKLQKIDKTQYHRHLNMASIIAIAALIAFALIYAQILIQLFSNDETSNFKFNFIGVILAIMTAAISFNFIKFHPYLYEIKYVWDLKQLQNKIYRKLHHIKKAAKANNIEALIILNYYYQCSMQIYTLDNNVLTMEHLLIDIANLKQQLEQLNLQVNNDDFDLTLLSKF